MALTGGCACRAVRYELTSRPLDCGWCHCRTCQLTSGAPAMAFATVADGGWAVISGADKVRRRRSSGFAVRLSCETCGTPLAIDYDIQPETFDFSVATLDDPGIISPGFHIFWSSKVAWFDPSDDLPKFEQFRPNTIGLEGTEPPA